MEKKKRILTIDIMRGFTLFLMLFVNDLFSKSAPAWLTHTSADYDGMGLADWVFPGFLFMVGMAIPFAIQNRYKKGDSTIKITYHIIIRTLSLLLIGVFMVNVPRLNSELTGINKNLWAIFMLTSVFLIWNQYGKMKNIYQYILKGIGIVGLLVLAIIFKAGTPEDITWIRTSWWGILGLIGWGYFISALTYLFTKDSLVKTGVIWIFFILLNVLSQLGMLNFLSFIKPVFGVIIDGNTPSIVIAGLFFSLILRKYNGNVKRFLSVGFGVGILALVIGFVFRNWFIISKIKATPSWAMLCNGISILLFLLLFFIIDVKGKTQWANIFKPAGQNSLTTYLAPDFIYYVVWLTGSNLLFYHHSESAFVVVSGSIVWAFTMIGFAAILSKIGIRLKL